MPDIPIRFNPARVSEYRKRMLPAWSIRGEDSADREIPAEEPTPRLAFWCLVVFMFFSYAQPAAWLPGHYAGPGTGLGGLAWIAAQMRLSLTPAVLSLIAVLTYKNSRGGRLLFTGPQTGLMALLVGCALLSVPFAAWPGLAFRFATSDVPKIFLLFILTINVVRNARSFRAFLWAVAICGCWVAIGTFLSNTWPHRFAVSINPSGRIGWAGYFGNANAAATALCMLVPVGLALAELATSTSKKMIALGLVGFYIIVMLLTMSRGAMVSLACVLLVYVASSRKKIRNFAIVIAVGLAALLMSKGALERASTILTYREDASAMSRLDLWKAGIMITLRNPVSLMVGVGGKCFGAATMDYFPATTRGLRGKASHNTYIQVLTELGVLGLAAFLTLVGVTLRDGRRLQKRFRYAADEEARDLGKMARAIFLTLTAISVIGITHHFAYEWLLYMFIALMVCLKQMAWRYGVYV